MVRRCARCEQWGRGVPARLEGSSHYTTLLGCPCRVPDANNCAARIVNLNTSRQDNGETKKLIDQNRTSLWFWQMNQKDKKSKATANEDVARDHRDTQVSNGGAQPSPSPISSPRSGARNEGGNRGQGDHDHHVGQAKEDKGVAAKAKQKGKGKAKVKQVMAEFYRLRAGQVDMFAFEKVGRELLLLLKGAGWYSAVMFR